MLGAACFVAVNYLFTVYIGLSIVSLTLLFIIPASFSGGLFSSILARRYIRKNELTLTSRQLFLVATIITIVGYIGSYYFIYMSAHIDDGGLNYTFSGEHISYYEYDGEPMTFVNFTSHTVLNSESQLMIRGNRSNPINLGTMTGYNGLMFFVSLFGFYFGSKKYLDGTLAFTKSFKEIERTIDKYSNSLIQNYSDVRDEYITLLKENINRSYVEKKAIGDYEIEEHKISLLKALFERNINNATGDSYLNLYLITIQQFYKNKMSERYANKEALMEEYTEKMEEIREYAFGNSKGNIFEQISERI